MGGRGNSESHRKEPHEARHLGYTRLVAEIHVNSITHAWFGHPLQSEHRATVARPRQEYEIAEVTVDGNAERFRPEHRQLSRLCSVERHHPDSQTHEPT